jgi:hypothetical protein
MHRHGHDHVDVEIRNSMAVLLPNQLGYRKRQRLAAVALRP